MRQEEWTAGMPMVIIGRMSEGKSKPVDDLKEGLNLLFRAAKGAVERLPTNKLEDVAKDAVKEVGRALESIGTELDKALGRGAGAPPPGHDPPPASTREESDSSKREEKKSEISEEVPASGGHAPDLPKGPRIG